MKSKLFDYVERDNWVYNLSGLTKLIGFILLTFASMYTYDIRCILGILILSFTVLKMSGITFSQIKMMLYYVAAFLLLNQVLTFLLAPTYGTEIYGTSHEIIRFSERYVLTQEQLLYQVTKLFKYVSVIPLGMLFLLTTNPSEFASSLNGVKISYRGCYAVALTLRYFPDILRDYNDISLAQQSRGLDMSKKEKTSTRIKNVLNICVPLIFSTLQRIDVISNAMDLRGFGKHKKRTWYARKPMQKSDYVCLTACAGVALVVFGIAMFINGGRFWNPFY
ncbi:MAG: energy-coupling factor transporter transmembrane protein EcfT [Lachnospiraceae bacterium]|nr:energy-coupling factor transporter transmembrane protein EcfT [Lachnospiraceae bacterium]